MDYGQVGKNAVTACPYCDELFTTKTDVGLMMGAIDVLTLVYKHHLTQSRTCREAHDAKPTLDETLAKLGRCFTDEEAKQEELLAAHPDNGKHGWWRVSGIRHEGTCRASSAKEAMKACLGAEVVGSWECAVVTFIGETLPDVF